MRTSIRVPVLLLGVALLGSLSACAGRLRAQVDDVDSLLAASGDGDFTALVEEGAAHWANRGEETEVLAAIASWNAALLAPTAEGVDRSEELAGVYTSLALAHYWLAHAHYRYIEDDGEAKTACLEQYTIGMEMAQNALALGNSEWNASLQGGASAADSVSLLTAEDVPAAYWYAANAGRWALLEGIVSALRYKDEIFAMMTRVQELDASYFHNAPDRYFGAYHTKLPLGNPNVELARQHFETAIEAAPNYLETRVLFVEEYAMKTNDRALAEEQLALVMGFNVDDAPDLRPENLNAQRRAQLILDEIDELFR
jgi:hypothetical protein